VAKTARSKAEPIASAPDASVPVEPAVRPSHEQIAERAYYIYLERGGSTGDPQEDWLQAERELTEGIHQ
jgi:hypothetical protein